MTDEPAPAAERRPVPRRSLILAGGGYKVAFQAGVLQVWLDEAGLEFDHADGASGGNLNLAMWCQGMSGRQIADNWRHMRPGDGIGLNWRSWWKLLWADSLLTLDRFRRNLLPRWGIDWARIRATEREATFNVYDFTEHELVPLPAADDGRGHAHGLDLHPDVVPARCAAAATPTSTPSSSPTPTSRRPSTAAPTSSGSSGRSASGASGGPASWASTSASSRPSPTATCAACCGASSAATPRSRRVAPASSGDTSRSGCCAREVPLHYLVVLSGDRVREAWSAACWRRAAGAARAGHPAARARRRPARTTRTRLRFTEEMKGFVARRRRRSPRPGVPWPRQPASASWST